MWKVALPLLVVVVASLFVFNAQRQVDAPVQSTPIESHAEFEIEPIDESPHAMCALASPRCPSPTSCQRFIVDDFVTPSELDDLRKLALDGMALGGMGDGGVTLLDVLHGIVSFRSQFADLRKLMERKQSRFSKPLVDTYEKVLQRIQKVLLSRFPGPTFALAKPAFFSLINNASANKPNDEYWHVHVDTDQYGSFDVTTLLYLSTMSDDAVEPFTFSGGTFDFVDAATDDAVTDVLAIPPVAGRLLVFSSGREHPHRVSKVQKGQRLAVTTAWTCDAKLGKTLPFTKDISTF